MKRFIPYLLLLVLLSGYSNAAAIESKILATRNKIFDGSQEIKALLPKSKDAVLLTSMFDSCIIAVSQIDAYFSMLGIFEAVKKEDLKPQTLNFLINWLNQIKKTDNINLGILKNVPSPLDDATVAQVEKVKGYFTELNRWVDAELVKFNILLKSQKAR